MDDGDAVGDGLKEFCCAGGGAGFYARGGG